MKLSFRRFDLQLAHRWTIASGLAPGGGGGTSTFKVVFVELTDQDGVTGLGEAAPSARYRESAEGAWSFLEQVDPKRLSFTDLDASVAYLNALAPGQFAAKGALNLALFDGAARKAGQAVCDFLKLGFTEGRHLTSFSIGLDVPEVIRQKVLEAAPYPILKLKVGGPEDRRNLAALREAAPDKTVRVDANEAWKTKEEALHNLGWLAADGRIEFVEQPMPVGTDLKDLVWLRERSPLPLMADESYHSAADLAACAEWAQAVNVKLVKSGGLSGAFDALRAARQAGLKTMLGCMIESSLLITAGAHLAALTDYLDLDGNLLITNDPYQGVTALQGRLSFADAPDPLGLRVRARQP